MSTTSSSCSSSSPSSDDDDVVATTTDAAAVAVANDAEIDHGKHHHHVAFGNCEVRTYTQVLGDHPCCLEGYPIQLGWDYSEKVSIIDVNDYRKGGIVGVAATPTYLLRLSPNERKEILLKQIQQNSATTSAAAIAATRTAATRTDFNDDNDINTPIDEQLRFQQSQAIAISVTDRVYAERELFRESNRLNRFGRNLGTTQSSRKQNRKNQRLFFGNSNTNNNNTSTNTSTGTIRTSNSNKATPLSPTASTTEKEKEEHQDPQYHHQQQKKKKIKKIKNIYTNNQ